MGTEVDRMLRQAMAQIADHLASFLPGLVVSLAIVLAALVAAVLVRIAIVRTLRSLDFDRWAEQLGFGGLMGWQTPPSPTVALARVAYWLILVIGLLVSLTALNASIPSRLALSAFEYLPHLVAALLILVVGAVAARFLARSVLIGAVNMHIQSARFLSLAVKWLILVLAVAMALDHLAIGRTVLLLAFGILFGGVVLAAALAVGLGARDAVGRAIERHLREPAARPENHIDHV